MNLYLQVTASVHLTDAFSEKINDLTASSTCVPGMLLPSTGISVSLADNSNITGSLIHENRVVLPASAQTTTPNTNSTVPSNESSLSSTAGAASVANHNVLLVSAIHDHDASSMTMAWANYSALPSESTGNHETTVTEKSAPMPGAAKKSSRMRPGTTNTARCD